LDWNIIFIIAKLLVVTNAQNDVEFFSLFSFKQAFNFVDVESVLSQDIEAFNAKNDLAKECVCVLTIVVLELDEESTHNAAK
jgi:hypothetical protein